MKNPSVRYLRSARTVTRRSINASVLSRSRAHQVISIGVGLTISCRLLAPRMDTAMPRARLALLASVRLRAGGAVLGSDVRIRKKGVNGPVDYGLYSLYDNFRGWPSWYTASI